MDVKENILSYENGNIENLKITPILERKKAVLRFERIIKRLIDIIGGGIGVLTLIPLTLIIWISNRIVKDNGPVFYTQERIGQNGKIFKMYKYRSMVVGADEKLEKYLAENENAREEYKKQKFLIFTITNIKN